MSEANLRRFISRVLDDSTLQDQLKEVTDRRAFAETAVRLGRENGFDFTARDVDAFLAQRAGKSQQELSDRDMELVAGGRPRQNGTFDAGCSTLIISWGGC